MNIKLNKPFGPNSPVEDLDVRQIKKALNRLGYYQAADGIGVTGIPDAAVFEALRAFQTDHDLPATGEVKPGDETITRLNNEVTSKPDGLYLWRTAGDDNVRKAHKALDGTVRNWNDDPDPGEEFNCRCWAEPLDDSIRPVYPELFLIPALKFKRIIKIIQKFYQHTKKTDLTAHGNKRSNQRGVSQKEVKEAIRTAKETGNVITKIGKYGTPQNHYRGSNGVTVIQETQGRNAGKIITIWRHK